MTDKCIHCGKNPTREDSAYLDKVTAEMYDINQIDSTDFMKALMQSGKIPVIIEWYSDGSRKVVVMEHGWSQFTLEEFDRHG